MGMAPLFRSLALLVLLVTLSSTTLPSSRATSGDGDDHDLLMLGRFHRWMSAHGRTYHSAAEKCGGLRCTVATWTSSTPPTGTPRGLGYELGENEFTDLTNEEFMARYVGGAYGGAGDGGGLITTLAGDVVEGAASSKNAIEEDRNLTMTASDPPRQFDWREHGVVTPAKQQGACGCCWAFAAAATVESLNKINGGELVDLSVQELVDCSTGVFSSPCGYGWPKSALAWIKSKGGLLTEAEYPYMAKRGRCAVHDTARVSAKSPASRMYGRAAARAPGAGVLGRPVTVQIDGSGPVLQDYKSGVYRGPCTTSQNHVVTVVGYGVTGAGEEYWIAKNSWGQTWGQKGFFFVRRGADGPRGLCGIAMYGAYPVM
uniref:Cysteine protease n=1 Tax=Triticum aestivum TaxID=4565 RepID=Q76CZ3_WHEAT|nr:cysteine protease [Triticum aestivum]